MEVGIIPEISKLFGNSGFTSFWQPPNENKHAHKYPRNLGFMIALMIFGCCFYLLATEYISAKKPKGEVLLFRRDLILKLKPKLDEESKANDRMNTETLAQVKAVHDAPANIQKQTAIFHWDSVSYDIKIKGKPRRILDDVDGWVIPGSLTALMVCSFPNREIGTKQVETGWLTRILGCHWGWQDHFA